MEYIWDKVIPIIEFEKSYIYLKIKVFFGILGELFVMNDINIYQLNIKIFKIKNLLLKICFFFLQLLNYNGKKFMCFKKNHYNMEMKEILKVGMVLFFNFISI